MDDTLKDDLEAFKLAEDAEKDQRTAMLELLKFVKLGQQWPDAVRKKRELEGRPCLTVNRLPAFGKQVINDARQNRPAIKCHPVGDGADKEMAEILNGLIRNIEYKIIIAHAGFYPEKITEAKCFIQINCRIIFQHIRQGF